MNAVTLRQMALVVSGLIGFFVPALFALDIYKNHLSQNVATWGMVLAIDFLGLLLAYKAGNKRPLLQAGWCVASVLILLAILSNDGLWHWGWVETISVACGITSIWLWQAKGAEFGMWPYMLALYISFVPQGVDFWKQPQPETLWLWGWSIVGCIFAIIGAEKRDFANTFIPWGAAILNVGISIIVLR